MLIDQSPRKVIKTFEEFGYVLVKQDEHIKMKDDLGHCISIPNHKRIKGSTIKGVCRQVGISTTDYENTFSNV